MKAATLISTIGWLDFGEEDQRRAREYLAQFKGDNTLDELGFGIIRDALADLFFPGTNTVMTRSRYLIFVPAICLIIEREKLAGTKAWARLKELEDKLRDNLCQGKDAENGVIGKRAQDKLERYPSEIYWNSLRRLNIFLPQWGRAYYFAHLSDIYKAMQPEKDDDGLSHLSNADWEQWDKSLRTLLNEGQSFLTSKGDIPSPLSFALTKHEASYLIAKYMALAERDKRPSLLSHLLGNGLEASFQYPWDVSAPAELAGYVDHARYFSMLVRGATFQYFDLLQEERGRRGIHEESADYADVFRRWWEATRQDLGAWNIDEFIALAEKRGSLRRNDHTFLKSWLGLNVKASSARGIWDSQDARGLIRRREKLTRPSKSRLVHADYLKRWKPPSASDVSGLAKNPDTLRYGLDYRARIGNMFVQDVMAPL